MKPIPGKEETKLGKPLRLHAMNAQQWRNLPLAQSETLTFTGTGEEWKPMF
jgi:hypothetical protein